MTTGEAGEGGAVRAVFLDRDGVLIGSDVVDGVPTPAATATLLPGVLDACTELRAAGLRLVMITNQPDIARGAVAAEHVHEVNERLRTELVLDDVRLCPHDDADDCGCRKPRSGMLTDAAAAAGIDLAGSVTVGDRWRDIEAGRGAGTRTVFVDHEYVERADVRADVVVTSLIEAVPWILDATREDRP